MSHGPVFKRVVSMNHILATTIKTRENPIRFERRDEGVVVF